MQRPTAVTVFGVLNIIGGVLGFLGLSLSDLSLLVPGMVQGFGVQAALLMQLDPLLTVWVLLRVSTRVIGSLVLLVAGIGLLKMKSWARVTAIVYGIFRICMSAVGFVITMAFIVPAMSRVAAPAGPAAPALQATMMFSAVVGTALALTYYILLIFFMTQRDVVEVLRANATPM